MQRRNKKLPKRKNTNLPYLVRNLYKLPNQLRHSRLKNDFVLRDRLLSHLASAVSIILEDGYTCNHFATFLNSIACDEILNYLSVGLGVSATQIKNQNMKILKLQKPLPIKELTELNFNDRQDLLLDLASIINILADEGSILPLLYNLNDDVKRDIAFHLKDMGF